MLCTECRKPMNPRKAILGYKIVGYFHGEPSHGGAAHPECVEQYQLEELLEASPLAPEFRAAQFAIV